MLVEEINDEQLLEMCLEMQHLRDFDFEGLSGHLITLYCMHEVGIGASLQVLEKKISTLLESYLKESLVKKGYLEANFVEDEIQYSLTEKGKLLFPEKEF